MGQTAEKRGDAGESSSSPLFRRDGVPAIGDLIPCSLQHVLASFAGIIAPAIMIAQTCNFTEAQETAIIQVALILSALDTVLQQFPLFGRIGSNLPILTGVSFAFLPAFQAVGYEFGFSTLLGAEIVGGACAILFGVFFRRVRRLFPPLVTGTVIFTIGVSLYPTAIKYMAGGVGSPIFGSVQSWAVGLLTFAVVFGLSNFGKGVVKLGAIFFGMIVGVALSLPLGMVDASGVAHAGWFALPQLMPFDIEFNPAACLTLAVVYIMCNVQLIGDLSAATLGSMDRLPTERELSGGLKAQGLVSIVSAFLGGIPTSAFGQNVGIIVSNRVINRFAFVLAAAVFGVAGFVPKLSAVLTMIPQPVIGGATIGVFGTITLNGIRMLVRDGLTPRSCTVFGVSVAFGLGIAQVTGCLSGQGMPDWAATIFGTSAITPCAVMAIVLNSVLPPEGVSLPSDSPAPNDLRVEAAAAVDANAEELDTLDVVTTPDEPLAEVPLMFDAAERMASREAEGAGSPAGGSTAAVVRRVDDGDADGTRGTDAQG